MSTWVAEQQVYAAWAQAIFSGLAIFAGFGVVQAQRWLDRRELYFAVGRLVAEGMDLLDMHAMDASDEMQSILGGGSEKFFGITSIRLAMEALPVGRLPSDLIASVATFTNFLRQAEMRLDRIEDNRGFPPVPANTPREQLTAIQALNRKETEQLELELQRLHDVASVEFRALAQRLRRRGVNLMKGKH